MPGQDGRRSKFWPHSLIRQSQHVGDLAPHPGFHRARQRESDSKSYEANKKRYDQLEKERKEKEETNKKLKELQKLLEKNARLAKEVADKVKKEEEKKQNKDESLNNTVSNIKERFPDKTEEEIRDALNNWDVTPTKDGRIKI